MNLVDELREAFDRKDVAELTSVIRRIGEMDASVDELPEEILLLMSEIALHFATAEDAEPFVAVLDARTVDG